MIETVRLGFSNYNIIDENNKIILNRNYEWISDVDIDKLRKVAITNDKWNLINEEGEFILKNDVRYITFCDKNGYRYINDKQINFLKLKFIKEIIK